ncbi:hypothetical protein QQ045_031455 [Rhodiola kirilowii]
MDKHPTDMLPECTGLSTVKEFRHATYRFIYTKPESGDRWCPPEEGCYKISCDGAWNARSKDAGIGVVCRDFKGTVIFVAAAPLNNQKSIVEVEVEALKLGMVLARKTKLSKVTFVSDNVEVIQALLSKPYLAKGVAWMEECIMLLESFQQWKLEHALRGANRGRPFGTKG